MLAPAEIRPRRTIEPPAPDGWIVATLAAVVALPIVVATVRALLDGWLAVGDNGNFLVRSRDVFTAHHPLLGTWSSASLPLGEDLNHPGPLMFDLFAIPTKLGGSGGLAVGVMLLQVACVALIAVFAWRVGGLRFAAASLAAAATLSWTMGSELLYDPWPPHTVLLPMLVLVVLVVAMAAGDTIALPVAAVVASLIVQTHLSYLLLVPPMCVWGVAWLVWRRRRDVIRPIVVAAVLAVVCWAQPIADQVNGEGNLGTMAGGVGQTEETVGASLGARLVAGVIALPPWSLRSSFHSSVRVPAGQGALVDGRPNLAGLPSGTVAAAGLTLVAGVLALAWFVARERRDRRAQTAVGVAAVAFAVAVGATVSLPVGAIGVSPHQVRYLWPLGVFITAVVVFTLTPPRRASGVLGGLAVALALLTLPTYDVQQGPNDDADAIPIVRELARQLHSLDDEGVLLYDTSAVRFGEPWASAVMAALQERDISFTVDEPGWVRQLGARRRDDGSADARIFLREGPVATEVPPGTRRVAYVAGLDAGERRELGTLERRLLNLDVRLNAAGDAARRGGFLPAFRDGTPTTERLLAVGELAALYNAGLLEVPGERAEELARYAELRFRWDRHTVGLFLDPTPY